jgi:hypothetical protein
MAVERTRFVFLVAAGMARVLHIAALLEKRLELALEALCAVGTPAAPR